jgi:hypothetical protein
MTGQPGRSGGANGGPQYNPANISATGGNGQSGQPKRYMSGLPYGSGGNMEQQGGARMAQAPSPTDGPATGGIAELQGLLEGLTPIDAPPSDPTVPVSTGVEVGRGEGEAALPAPYRADQRSIENLDLIKKYLPDLVNATRVDGAPDSYKKFVNYLKSQVI